MGKRTFGTRNDPTCWDFVRKGFCPRGPLCQYYHAPSAIADAIDVSRALSLQGMGNGKVAAKKPRQDGKQVAMVYAVGKIPNTGGPGAGEARVVDPPAKPPAEKVPKVAAATDPIDEESREKLLAR